MPNRIGSRLAKVVSYSTIYAFSLSRRNTKRNNYQKYINYPQIFSYQFTNRSVQLFPTITPKMNSIITYTGLGQSLTNSLRKAFITG